MNADTIIDIIDNAIDTDCIKIIISDYIEYTFYKPSVIEYFKKDNTTLIIYLYNHRKWIINTNLVRAINVENFLKRKDPLSETAKVGEK